MSEPDDCANSDFDSQLRGLFVEAEREIEQRAGGASAIKARDDRERDSSANADEILAEAPPKRVPAMTLPQLLRPIVQGIESLSRSSGANAALLQKIDSHLGPDAKTSEQGKGLAGELRAMLEMKHGVSQNMFSALHDELRGYKDGFLLEAVQKPIIRDLINIYDDLAELRRQVGQSALEPMPEGEKHSSYTVRLYDRIRVLHTNLDHQLEFVIEVLARLDVTQIDPHMETLNKKTQRAVAVEMAEDPDEDNRVVKIVKRGFQWRDRVVRPEEVVIRKWKEGYLVALQCENPPPPQT